MVPRADKGLPPPNNISIGSAGCAELTTDRPRNVHIGEQRAGTIRSWNTGTERVLSLAEEILARSRFHLAVSQ